MVSVACILLKDSWSSFNNLGIENCHFTLILKAHTRQRKTCSHLIIWSVYNFIRSVLTFFSPFEVFCSMNICTLKFYSLMMTLLNKRSWSFREYFIGFVSAFSFLGNVWVLSLMSKWNCTLLSPPCLDGCKTAGDQFGAIPIWFWFFLLSKSGEEWCVLDNHFP